MLHLRKWLKKYDRQSVPRSYSPELRLTSAAAHRSGHASHLEIWCSAHEYNMTDSRSRSRSPPPRREERRRSRSRSPRRRREDDRPKPRSGGFKWKEKRRDEDRRDGEDEKRLERGYRERDRPRARSPDRQKPAEEATEPQSTEKPKKEKKEKKAVPAPTGEPMIIVHVNDRLGTKAAIPCLASDPISKISRSCDFASLVLTIGHRAIQSAGRCTYRTGATRDYAEKARGEAFQGSAHVGGLWC